MSEGSERVVMCVGHGRVSARVDFAQIALPVLDGERRRRGVGLRVHEARSKQRACDGCWVERGEVERVRSRK